MMEENMDNIQIGWKDVLWNYTATILKVGVGLILLPFILHSFSKDGLFTQLLSH